MDHGEAIRAIEDIGHSYFFDWIDVDLDEIIAEIHSHYVSSSGKLYWENRRNGMAFVLDNCSDECLDDLVSLYFNRTPKEVGGSRTFMQRIIDAMKKEPLGDSA